MLEAENSGLEVSICPVLADGTLIGKLLDPLLGADVALISVMLVNNETGVIQDIARVTQAAKAFDIKVHCDAAQGLGKTPIDVNALGVVSSASAPTRPMVPWVSGRSTSVVVHARDCHHWCSAEVRNEGCAAVPSPCPLRSASPLPLRSVALQKAEAARLAPIQTWFEEQVQQRFPLAQIKNNACDRVANTINISFPDIAYQRLFDHVHIAFCDQQWFSLQFRQH